MKNYLLTSDNSGFKLPFHLTPGDMFGPLLSRGDTRVIMLTIILHHVNIGMTHVYNDDISSVLLQLITFCVPKNKEFTDIIFICTYLDTTKIHLTTYINITQTMQ